MKKLMYLFVAACITTVASAQKVTEKDLQGTWKLTSLETGEMKIDAVAEKVTFTPQSQLTPEMKQQVEADIAQSMDLIKDSYTYVEGKNLKQTMGPEEHKGTYIMTQKDGKNVMTLSLEDGTTEAINITIVDKKLHMSMDDQGQKTEFVYSKQ